MRTPSENTLLLSLIVVSLLLQLMPLPLSIMVFKPWFLGLIVAYYTLELPEKMGLGTAFLLGLMADCVTGAQLFGEQALRLVILVYIIMHFRYRLRFFPLWQQTGAIAALLVNDRVLTLWVHWMADGDRWNWATMLSPLFGALLWPILFVILDRARFFARIRKY